MGDFSFRAVFRNESWIFCAGLLSMPISFDTLVDIIPAALKPAARKGTMARELLPGGSSALQPLMYDTANPCSFQLITNSVNCVVYNPFAQSSRRVAHSFSCWLTYSQHPPSTTDSKLTRISAEGLDDSS